MMSLSNASPLAIGFLALFIIVFGICIVVKLLCKSLDKELDDHLKSKGLVIIACLLLPLAGCRDKSEDPIPEKIRPRIAPDKQIPMEPLKYLNYTKTA